MDEIWFYVYATPDYLDPTGRRGLVFRGTPGYIWVNQQGRRFHDESRTGGASASPALMRQDPAHAWAILDTPMTAAMGVADPYYQEGGRIGATRCRSCSTIPLHQEGERARCAGARDRRRRADLPR